MLRPARIEPATGDRRRMGSRSSRLPGQAVPVAFDAAQAPVIFSHSSARVTRRRVSLAGFPPGSRVFAVWLPAAVRLRHAVRKAAAGR